MVQSPRFAVLTRQDTNLALDKSLSRRACTTFAEKRPLIAGIGEVGAAFPTNVHVPQVETKPRVAQIQLPAPKRSAGAIVSSVIRDSLLTPRQDLEGNQGPLPTEGFYTSFVTRSSFVPETANKG